jgi:riboflavin kinase / FMN adenylyltransferase
MSASAEKKLRVVHGLEELAPKPYGCVAAVGNFDGVHRGHQKILAQARTTADTLGVPLTALTFEPAPVRLLAPEKAPEPLMHLDQRWEALHLAGADVVVVVRTTDEFLTQTPEQFAAGVLVGALGVKAVVEGDNFFFGHGRAGNVQTLRELGGRLGFDVQVVEPVMVQLDGRTMRISSSLVRRFVREGRVEAAAECLGRPHTLRGGVVKGHGRGGKLGYPTANLDCGSQLLPADGVYAARAGAAGTARLAAVSIGTRPTFGKHERAAEVYLLDYAGGDLYGSVMDVGLARRLRGQEKFASAQDLINQMEQDVQHVRDFFKQ